MSIIPEEFLDLMQQPAFAQLATMRPDGTPQVNPMFFDWDGSRLRFSHKSNRQKFRNIAQNPHIAASIPDLDNPYRYIEVRGTVEDVSPDTDGAFLRRLTSHYRPGAGGSPDIEHRVVITVVVTHAAGWVGRRPDDVATPH
jgi:PPOX class probable F420-dependent enzyme